MYIVFFSTSDVFEAEERLNNSNVGCKVVPTPVTDKAYCGVCIKINDNKYKPILEGMEYSIVQ
ncbi:uncharacterized protein DUF3343 [Ruminiclostridium sufflavum DSM 19573]|uniref:Uncharacterized protein DUF3343 n=1 Tax=Ruminiclostridium sufflavum DSM 19573 TaxID=1121337 RepID=A0A318XJU1_9FIRM|nr:uncharacterized protein DUF3343 [Ruminiclostridium sufflavum DSM 19573]